MRFEGAQRILTERVRQVKEEGHTAVHDDELHTAGELIAAAISYASVAYLQVRGLPTSDPLRWVNWPWETEEWKPSSDPVRNLEKAGALLAAEIDRQLRHLRCGGGLPAVGLSGGEEDIGGPEPMRLQTEAPRGRRKTIDRGREQEKKDG